MVVETNPLAVIDPAELKLGVNFVGGNKIIVFLSENGELKACLNRCRHQGGAFLQNGGNCELTCSRHGWILDLSRMIYINPTNHQTQSELDIEWLDNGRFELREPVVEAPWGDVDPLALPLERGELSIRFYAHACCEISLGSIKLFTDPWLEGPAFGRGWWLKHKPPNDWLERLSEADFIYISHNHSDHLNAWTLQCLAKVNTNIPVLVPAFESDSCVRMVRDAGMDNVQAIEFDQWVDLGDQARMMILRDGTGRDDSGLLVEYKGHRILNAVDCNDLNSGVLPKPVDALLMAFAGGASGFPVCWEDLLTTEERRNIIQKNLAIAKSQVVKTSKLAGAKLFVPFAGFFKEAHPSDYEVSRENKKNRPEDVVDAVRKSCPETSAWIPSPGDVYDFSCDRVVSRMEQVPVVHDFDHYLSVIAKAQDFDALQSLQGIERYFDWAGYQSDLVLHVQECGEDFGYVTREFYVDFERIKVSEQRPTRNQRYLRMKVRTDIFRHVLKNGQPWEEISIGFSARFYREPNVYNMDFWDHFQNHLPPQRPFE